MTNLLSGIASSSTSLSKQEYNATINTYPSFRPIDNGSSKVEGSTSLPKQNSIGRAATLLSPELSPSIVSAFEENYVNNYNSISSKASPSGGNISEEVLSSSSVVTGDVSNTSSKRSDSSMNILEELVHEDMQYFQEGYFKSTNLDKFNQFNEHITEVDRSTSHCNKANREEDADSDDMLGGVFAFSEEGV